MLRERRHGPAIWRGLLDLIAPARCASCREPLDETRDRERRAPSLCPRCRRALPWIEHEGRCSLCQGQLDGSHPGQGEHICPACRLRPSHLESCVAAVEFDGEAERWIHRFKYPAPGLAGLDPAPLAVLRECAREAADRVATSRATCVIPVPLHRRRLRARGFNPAALLAREIARANRVPLDCGWLRRTRDTPSQTGLDRSQRRQNVAGAFACRNPQKEPPQRVWLVDDVVTTGATLNEAAAVLRDAGVSSVVGICLARTTRRDVAGPR